MQNLATLSETGMPSNAGLSRQGISNKPNDDVGFLEILGEQDISEQVVSGTLQEHADEPAERQPAPAEDLGPDSLDAAGVDAEVEMQIVAQKGLASKETFSVPEEAALGSDGSDPLKNPGKKLHDAFRFERSQVAKAKPVNNSPAEQVGHDDPQMALPSTSQRHDANIAARSDQKVAILAETRQANAAPQAMMSNEKSEATSVGMIRSNPAAWNAPATKRHPPAVAQGALHKDGAHDVALPADHVKTGIKRATAPAVVPQPLGEEWTFGANTKSMKTSAVFLQAISEVAFRETHGAIEAAAATRLDLPTLSQTTHSELRAFSAREIPAVLVQLVRAQPEGSAELQLHPEELGRVRITFGTAEMGPTLNINLNADRQETLDLMRRHLHELQLEMKRQGFQDVSFSFGSQSNNDSETSRSQPEGSETKPTDNKQAIAEEIPAAAHEDLALLSERVDIRI